MLSITFLALSVLLFSVSAQDCSQRPKVRPSECCPGSFPQFMTPALASECGLPADRSSGPPSLDATLCVLRKNNLLTADNKIDKPAFKVFSERQYSSEWTPAINAAHSICDASVNTDNVGTDSFGSYIECLAQNLLKNCPASVAVQTTECSDLMAHMEKCPRNGPPPMGQ